MASIEPTKIDPKTGRPARDARWRARYRDPAGRSRSQTFNRKLDAERFLNSTGVDLDRGDFIDPRTQRSTFGEWAELWWDSAVHLKPSTVRGYRPARDRLVAEFGDWPVAKIDRAEVKGFVARLSREGLSGKTIRNNVLVLALILTEAVEGRVLRENPARGVKIPKAPAPDPRFLTAEQVAALVNATRPDYRFLVLFLAYTGLRSSEACGLRIRNLDVIRGRVRVVETLMQIEGKIIVGTPKNYKGRTVPLPEFLRDEAAQYLAARSAKLGCVLDPDEFVFPPIRNARQRPQGGVPRVAVRAASHLEAGARSRGLAGRCPRARPSPYGGIAPHSVGRASSSDHGLARSYRHQDDVERLWPLVPIGRGRPHRTPRRAVPIERVEPVEAAHWGRREHRQLTE